MIKLGMAHRGGCSCSHYVHLHHLCLRRTNIVGKYVCCEAEVDIAGVFVVVSSDKMVDGIVKCLHLMGDGDGDGGGLVIGCGRVA